VFDCPVVGCGGGATTIATNQDDPLSVAVDDSGVYWTNGNAGTVMRCPLSGCVTPTQIAQTEGAFAIALDAVSVYFTNSTIRGEVLRVAK
jgi:hypothetical protein